MHRWQSNPIGLILWRKGTSVKAGYILLHEMYHKKNIRHWVTHSHIYKYIAVVMIQTERTWQDEQSYSDFKRIYKVCDIYKVSCLQFSLLCKCIHSVGSILKSVPPCLFTFNSNISAEDDLIDILFQFAGTDWFEYSLEVAYCFFSKLRNATH